MTILRRVQTGTDSLNSPIFEWQSVRTVWAEEIHKREDERFAVDQRYAVRVVTFRTHYLSDISEVDRLECDGLTYDVKGIRELGFHEGTEIAAEWQQ